jgi:hypothetical protein
MLLHALSPHDRVLLYVTWSNEVALFSYDIPDGAAHARSLAAAYFVVVFLARWVVHTKLLAQSGAERLARERECMDGMEIGPKIYECQDFFQKSKKPGHMDRAFCLISLVGREWLEHSTYGLRVRCSTN